MSLLLQCGPAWQKSRKQEDEGPTYPSTECKDPREEAAEGKLTRLLFGWTAGPATCHRWRHLLANPSKHSTLVQPKDETSPNEWRASETKTFVTVTSGGQPKPQQLLKSAGNGVVVQVQKKKERNKNNARSWLFL